MTRRQFLAMTMLPMLTIIGVIVLWKTEQRGHQRIDGGDRRHEMLDEVIGLLQQHYDGPIDVAKLVDGSLAGAATAVGDRYTELWAPAEAKEQAARSEGQFGGIGVSILRRPDGTVLIAGVNPGGPADQAGLTRRDVILAVAGVELKGIDFAAVGELVRGEVGSEVILSILRGEERKEIVVVRGNVPIRSVEGARMLEGSDIGYIRIESFNAKTSEQFIDAWHLLKGAGMKRLVLDLRYNHGGNLLASIEIADLFIAAPNVPIVSVKASSPEKLARLPDFEPDFSGGTVYLTKDDKAMVDVPCVLLQNGETASAAEVLGGCLQDYGIAFIIGERSFGKGVVQRTFELRSDPRYLLKVTVASYFTPLGNNLMQRDKGGPGGIEPDLYLPLSTAQAEDLARRYRVQGFQVPRTADEIVDDEDRAAWQRPDVHLEAAQDYLKGRPVAKPLDLPK